MTLWTVAHQTSLAMKFSRQEHWSGFPGLSPGNLPYLGIKPGSPVLQADFLPSEPLRKSMTVCIYVYMYTVLQSIGLQTVEHDWETEQ